MKFLALCLLSSFATATPQDSADYLEAVLEEVFEEIALAAQESAEVNGQVDEERMEQLGLQIAVGALSAVAELIPTVAETANSAIRSVNYALANDDRILIGITGGTPSAALCAHLGVNSRETIIVNSIGPGMSAEKAGLEVHDLIVEIEGYPLATMERLRDTLDLKQVGDVLNLTIINRGQRRPLSIPILEAQQWSGLGTASGGFYDPEQEERATGTYFGDTLRELAESERQAALVEAELARVQAEADVAANEIDAARAQYQEALNLLELAKLEDRASELQKRERWEAVARYEELLAQEETRLAELRDMQTQREMLREHAAARSAELLAREEARFVRDTLVMPDRPDVSRAPRTDSHDRIGKVEQRVDELHSRFDRLEEMLARIAAGKDN